MAIKKLPKHTSYPPNDNYPTETSSGLQTGHVEYNREIRKVARVYTAYDAARIAKLASVHTSPLIVAAYILAALGIGTGLCKTAASLERILGMWGFIEDAATIMATGAVVEVLLQRLGKVKIPLIKRFTIALIVLLALIQKVVGMMINLVSDVMVVRGLATEIRILCDHIKNAPDNIIRLIPD
jgi:hypothetical protein